MFTDLVFLENELQVLVRLLVVVLDLRKQFLLELAEVDRLEDRRAQLGRVLADHLVRVREAEHDDLPQPGTGRIEEQRSGGELDAW